MIETYSEKMFFLSWRQHSNSVVITIMEKIQQ